MSYQFLGRSAEWLIGLGMQKVSHLGYWWQSPVSCCAVSMGDSCALPDHILACLHFAVEDWKCTEMPKCIMQNSGTFCFESGTIYELGFKDDCSTSSQGERTFPSTCWLMLRGLLPLSFEINWSQEHIQSSGKSENILKVLSVEGRYHSQFPPENNKLEDFCAETPGSK